MSQPAKCPICNLNCVTEANVKKHAFKLHGILPGTIIVDH